VAALGCTSPLKVVQLESLDQPAEGVRYALRRPVFGVGLRLSRFDEDAKDCFFSLVVIQKMEDRRFYEVRRPPWYVLPLHALSNTAVSIVLDDAGHLTSVTAEETDQTIEFVKAVAQLVVESAAFAKDPPKDSSECGILLKGETEKKWAAYYEQRKTLGEERTQLANAREKLLKGLAGFSPVQQEKALTSLATLDARLEAVSKRIADAYFPVADADYTLLLGEEPIAGKGGAWLEVSLEPWEIEKEGGKQ
jgi:hypothetical protein